MKVPQALVRLGIMLLGAVLFVLLLGLVQAPLHRAKVSDVIAVPIVLAVALAAYAGIMRVLERRQATELAIRFLPLEGLSGLALGFALFAATIGVLALMGVYRATAGGAWAGVGVAFLTTLVAAVAEELLFRGFLFRTVRDLFGTPAGVAVSAVLFGAAHAFNPGASVFSSIAIALEAGVLLSLAYAVTNRLWLPIGIHTAWNFAESSIFGTSVSGHATIHAVLKGSLQGPALLTGGSFGPEASIVALSVCLLAAAAFAARVLRTRPAQAYATA